MQSSAAPSAAESQASPVRQQRLPHGQNKTPKEGYFLGTEVPGKPQGLQTGGVGGRKKKLTHKANEQLVLGTSNALHGDNSDVNWVASWDWGRRQAGGKAKPSDASSL